MELLNFSVRDKENIFSRFIIIVKKYNSNNIKCVIVHFSLLSMSFHPVFNGSINSVRLNYIYLHTQYTHNKFNMFVSRSLCYKSIVCKYYLLNLSIIFYRAHACTYIRREIDLFIKFDNFERSSDLISIVFLADITSGILVKY